MKHNWDFSLNQLSALRFATMRYTMYDENVVNVGKII